MNNFELQPTIENVVSTFCDNTLNRNQDVFDFLNILLTCDNGYSIAVNGYWGSGKTFFIRHVHMILACLNNFVENEYIDDIEDIKDKIETDLKCNLTNKQFLPIYYDAWENDNDNDPILSIIFSIVQQLKLEGETEKIETATKNVIGSLSKLLLNCDITELIKKSDILSDIKSSKDIKGQIDIFLSTVNQEKGHQIVIFIDELDRCKPDFAVKLLERIKHYFNCSDIIFVFSVNLIELQHTVSNCYGAGFNSSKYLQRFFNMKVDLPKVDPKSFCEYNGYYFNSSRLGQTSEIMIKHFNMELRDISKYLTTIHRNMSEISTIRTFHHHTKIEKFIKNIMLPVAYALRITNIPEYRSFISGNNFELLKKICVNNYDHMKRIFSQLIVSDNETLHKEQAGNGNKEFVDYIKRLEEVYNSITKDTDEDTKIGSGNDVYIDNNLRKMFHRLLSC